MKQIVQSAKNGKRGVRDVPPPNLKSGCVLVETRSSLISAGTERSMAEFAKSSLLSKAKARPDLVRKVLDKAKRDGLLSTLNSVRARLDEPMPLGYSAAGRVKGVGRGLEGRFFVGQRVAIAGAGLANHAELNVVPENLVAAIPDDVSDEDAAFCTLGSIAMHSVRNLSVGLGDQVAVLGAGLVGQLAAQFLSLAGARVLALDYDRGRLELVQKLGAEITFNLGDGSPEESVLSWTGGLGCDAVLIAAATKSSEPFLTAANIARDRARICLVGLTGTEFPYREFMQKELSIVVSRSYGPGRYDTDFEEKGMKYPPGFVRWTETANLAEAVRLMSPRNRQRLDVGALITHRFDFDCAEEAYQLILEGTKPHLGVILSYPEHKTSSLEKPTPRAPMAKPGSCRLAVVGAGNFARTVLLPKLKDIRNCTLDTLVTSRGMTADHFGNSFGFAKQTTDFEEMLRDPDINAVLLATPHSSHARMTAAALRAGKSVFVEKPLGLTREELDEVRAARARSVGFFTVGFNRRFAPMMLKVKAALETRVEPAVILFRVNAGSLPDDTPLNSQEEGGGRILGECCHFIDLARFLVGAPIIEVSASAAQVTHGVCDDLSISLRFEDGSLATILYTSKGDSAFSKERYEIFVGGSVIVVDNFLSYTTAFDGKTKTTKARLGQDKGHGAELKAFVDGVARGAAPIEESELLDSSLATLAVTEALATGMPVKLE